MKILIFLLLLSSPFHALGDRIYYSTDFQSNPLLDTRLKHLMVRHLLPLHHPLKPQLDAIFSSARVTADKRSLQKAGFEIIAEMQGSFVIVARQPLVPGYVFKLYLDSETRCKDEIPNSEWLIKRCIGAQKIRQLIRKKHLIHFKVPDKWLYVLPLSPYPYGPNPQPVIVIETDMQLESAEVTAHAWKNLITHAHLNELYEVLKHGFGSTNVLNNIPYTKNGTFAFTDTEYPKRMFSFDTVEKYLSREMRSYWKRLYFADQD